MSHVVLLSGWGIDARIWQPLAAYWPEDVTVSTPDWPGYGDHAPLDDPGNLEALAEAMAGELPEHAVWVGWSLGALLAASLLEHLPTPRTLVLLGMNARFTVAASSAITATVGVTANELATFQRAFERDPEKTWRHFLRWQLAGEPDTRSAHRRLEHLLCLDELPADKTTLASGLNQLARLDISHLMASPAYPTLRVRGSDDPLLSMPDGREYAVIMNAGHCPQLSVPGELAKLLCGLARHPNPFDDDLRGNGDGR